MTARLTRRPLPAPRGGRTGFTLPEILIVIVMISLLALVAIPRFATANGKRHLESARLRIGASLVSARQAAIQKGRTVRFEIKNNRVSVAVSTDTLLSPVPLDVLYKVTTSDLTIDFTARGFAVPSTAQKIMLTRSGTGTDSVVTTKFGMVKR